VRLWEAIRMALGALWVNRLRSLLTVLGTVVAVLAIVSVVAITQGLNRYVAKQLLSTGSHVFTLSKYGIITSEADWYEAAKRRRLTLADADALREQMTTAEAVVPSLTTVKDVEWRGRRLTRMMVQGLGHEYPALGETFPLVQGRHLTAEDERAERRQVVLGWDVADRLFGGNDPVGERVRIGRESFWVAGVLERRGKVLGFSRDEIALVPVTTYQKLFGRRQSVDISILAASPELYEPCQEEAELLLKLRRGLKPWEDPDFGKETSETLYALYSRATGAFFLGMIAIASLSLLIGGIVIMNIMLVAVSERTREIGIAKAVGARRRDIRLQFLVESATLAGLGGLIGVALGAGIAALVEAASPLPARIEGWSVAVSLLVALAVGISAGLYPAMRAARLAPVEALRQEK
jgi:putative ABC transport system permease protein